MEPAPRFVGIDVSEAHLDVASRPDGQEFRLPNTAEGIAALVARLREMGPALVILEATGGLEWPAASALAEAGLPVRVIEPGRARHFARSIGQHSKTDALDARALARYAEAVRPEARELPDEATRELRALVDRRRQLVSMRTSQQNRLHQASADAVEADLEKHIAYLSELVAEMDRQIGQRIRSDERWRPRDVVLRSIPGVGPQTSRQLLCALPEIGRLTGRQVSALAGLAPRARDSGSMRGARTSFGGRAEIRTALYMASISAITYTPPLEAIYQRLLAAGKAPKSALIAVARKLLTIANAMIRDLRPWSPNPADAPA